MKSQILQRAGLLLVGLALGVLATVAINIALGNSKGSPTPQDKYPSAIAPANATKMNSQATTSAVQLTGSEDATPRQFESVPEWSVLVNDHQSDVRQIQELDRAAQALFELHGVAILDHIYDSISDQTVRDAIAKSVLYKALENGYRDVFEQAKHLQGEVRRWALHEVVVGWAQVDPRATFAAVWSLNSTDSSIRSLQRRAVWEWAEVAPQTVLEDMEAIPDNVRDFAEEKALLALARIAPTAAIKYLPNLAGSAREATLAKEIATHWVQIDLDACLAWVESFEFSIPGVVTEVKEAAFRAYAREEPELAMDAALKQSTHIINGGMESNVIAEVAKFDPDLALRMLTQTRDDITTVFNSYLSVAQELVATHLDFDAAIELGEEIPIWKDDFYNRLAMYWASYHPVELLNRVEHFPEENRSFAAKCLIKFNSMTLVLSSRQVAQAGDYLTQDDLRELTSSLPGHYANSVRISTP